MSASDLAAPPNDRVSRAIETNDIQFSEDQAAEELLSRFLPKDEGASKKEPPSEKKTKEKSAETTETEDADEGTAKEEPEPKKEASEEEETKEDKEEDAEAEVTIRCKVGDKEEDVPASELARLWGQEQALTKKSMEVAEQRKAYEAKLEEQVATTAAILERSKARYEPFAKLDFNLLAAEVAKGTLTADEYNSLRQSAQAAYEEHEFLSKHTSAFMGRLNQQRQAEHVARAQAAIKELGGSPEKGGLEGWNEKLYDDIRSFAIAQGEPADAVNNCVVPSTIRMWHSAMLYARGKDKTKITTTKIVKTPKKIVKTTNSPSAEKQGGTPSEKKAAQQFKRSGSSDDAAELLLARWAKDSDD